MASPYPAALSDTSRLKTSWEDRDDGTTGADTATPPAAGATAGGLADQLNKINEDILAIQTELGLAPDGGASSVRARLDSLNAVVGGTLAPFVGRYYDGAMFSATTTATFALVALTQYLMPFKCGVRMSVDRIAVNRTAAAPATAGTIKLAIYNADDATGAPTTTLNTPAGLTVAASAAAGVSEATISQQFGSGKLYWLGVWADQAYTLSALPQASIPPFGGLAASNGTTYGQRWARASQAIANAWTSPFVPVASELSTAAGISIRMRVATVG